MLFDTTGTCMQAAHLCISSMFSNLKASYDLLGAAFGVYEQESCLSVSIRGSGVCVCLHLPHHDKLNATKPYRKLTTTSVENEDIPSSFLCREEIFLPTLLSA